MDTHTRARVCALHMRARIYSFFLTLTRGKTMFSHDQILINPKSYGHVHDVCQETMCLQTPYSKHISS